MAIAFVGKQITDTISKFEKLEASLRTINGSSDKTAMALGFIQGFSISITCRMNLAGKSPARTP